MTAASRESLLATTFATLADTMVAGYDIVELLQTLVERTIEVVDAEAAGIILIGDSQLEVVASTDESNRLVDLMQLRAGRGPCVEAYLTGDVVAIERLDAETRWPAFAASARELGYSSVHSVPLRLRTNVIGALNLFGVHPGPLSVADAIAARALADVATIGILHERAFRESDLTRQQLQRALDSRVVIEQAKGYLAHTLGCGMDDAFARMRSYARAGGLRLNDVAAAVLNRSVEL